MKRVVHLSAGITALAIVLTGPLFIAHTAVHAAPLASPPFTQGHLVVSRSVYQGFDTLITVGQALPGGGTATVNGSYPGVWANETPDASFGVTSPIFLDEMTTDGTVVQSVPVDTGQVVTSFSSKSEIALNLSSDGTALTFTGYVAPVNALDVSNSNTPNHVDTTNPVAEIDQRAVGQIDATQHLQVTPVDAYSGNNGRAVVAAKAADGNFYFYMVGNAGNGGDPEPISVVDNTGVQMTPPLGSAETMVVGVQQGTPGSACGFQFGFSVALVGINPCPTSGKQDKSGKDDNFRGVTIFNNTLYVTKGSGSNGINAVYKVDGGSLPTPATASTTTISLLPNFPPTLARASSGVTDPFGIWFANATTLYVADEGNGTLANPNAGLQKWTFDGTGWNRKYVLQAGLNRGTQYSIDGYPTNLNPATDGLRNITGTVSADGTSATIYAVTSTTSASTDQGADPNKIVVITDAIGATTLPGNEQFADVRTAKYGEVLRGVSFAPRTLPSPVATPQPAANGAGWQHTSVSVSLTATADSSGIQDLQVQLERRADLEHADHQRSVRDRQRGEGGNDDSLGAGAERARQPQSRDDADAESRLHASNRHGSGQRNGVVAAERTNGADYRHRCDYRYAVRCRSFVGGISRGGFVRDRAPCGRDRDRARRKLLVHDLSRGEPSRERQGGTRVSDFRHRRGPGRQQRLGPCRRDGASQSVIA